MGDIKMSKYKFRLSYIDIYGIKPIELSKLECLNGLNMTDIKEIDKFTTKFKDLNELLKFLKTNKLIPQNIDNLYISFDVKEDNVIKQQYYAYNKRIFFKNDSEKLKTSYACSIIRNKIQDGCFINDLISHYMQKYPYKNFNSLYTASRYVARYGYHSLTPSEQSLYREEINSLISFIFYTTGNIKKTYYKSTRDFICYIYGDKALKVKKTKESKNTKLVLNEFINDFQEEDNLTYNEHNKFIKTSLKNHGFNMSETEVIDSEFNKNIALVEKTNKDIIFEPYRDGNDWISPANKEEIEESLNEYSRKLCFKRDNGDYE